MSTNLSDEDIEPSVNQLVRDAYVLGIGEDAELSSLLQARYDPDLSRCRELGHRGMVIAVQGSDPLAKLGRVLEQRVFDAKARNHSPDVMVEEFGEYEHNSMFFLAVNPKTGDINAVLRLLVGLNGIGMPVKSIRDTLRNEAYQDSFEAGTIDLTENTISLEAGVIGRSRSGATRLDRVTLETFHGMEPGEITVDIATVAVSPHCRGTDAGLLWVPLLVAAAFRAMAKVRLRHAVTFVQQDFLTSMREHYGLDWVDLGGLGPTRYVEGDLYLSQPVYLDVASMWRKAQASEIGRTINRSGKKNRVYDRLTKLMMLPDSDSRFVFHAGRETHFS